MILATTNGWLIAGYVVKETEKQYTFKPIDSEKTRKVKKSSSKERIFDDVLVAMGWIDNMNKRGV